MTEPLPDHFDWYDFPVHADERLPKDRVAIVPPPQPLGPPYCDEPSPHDPSAEPIRCAFVKGHEGPHGWDLTYV